MFTLILYFSFDLFYFKYSRVICGLRVGQYSLDSFWVGVVCFCISIFYSDGIIQYFLLVVGIVVFVLVLQFIYFVLLLLDIFVLFQDCGLEFNDEDGYRCYLLEDYLFCYFCYVKRLEKGFSFIVFYQYRFQSEFFIDITAGMKSQGCMMRNLFVNFSGFWGGIGLEGKEGRLASFCIFTWDFWFLIWEVDFVCLCVFFKCFFLLLYFYQIIQDDILVSVWYVIGDCISVFE